MKTSEEILKSKYFTDQEIPNKKGILDAMEEYAIEYHKSEVKKLNLHNVSKCEGNVRKATLIAYVIKNINESSDEEIDKMYQQLDEILK